MFSSLVIVFFSNIRLENYQDMENWPVVGYYDITSEYGEQALRAFIMELILVHQKDLN